MVKNNNFKKGVLAALMLVSPLVSAETDYPAADFQPKVLYSDTDYKHTGSTATSSKAKKTEFDANYPAANFEPKVVFQDSKYKHKKDVVAAPKSRPTSSSAESETSTGEVAKESSDQTMLMGLIVLAAAGFFFYRKRSIPAPKSKTSSKAARAPVYTGGGGGLTGVAKYLSGKEGGIGTGVAKYLASREGASAVTGVAKYLVKQVGAARKVVAENATGVEKYLRNKG